MIKHYKNGNLHIKFEPDFSGLDTIEKIYFNFDMHPVTSEYCISNYDTASIWSYNGGYSYYEITSYDLVALEAGKTVILKSLPDSFLNNFRYEILLGFNTKQWWAYDNFYDEYVDIPSDILNGLPKENQENYLREIVNKNPEWLYDQGYRYDDIEI